MRTVAFRVLDACRICFAPLRPVVHVCDSGIANSLELTQEDALNAPVLPLKLMACTDCGLFQLSIAVDKEALFGNYTYATPDTPLMREHYVDAAAWIPRRSGIAVEIGGNTGAFLTMLTGRFERLVNVEPAQLPQVEGNHEVVNDFFDVAVAERVRGQWGAAGLISSRHCFAHIDDLHGIMNGVKKLLAPDGVFYVENAYVLDTLLDTQFDQIYHEHMSYLSLGAVDRLMRMHGMCLVDASVSPLHGGSIMMLAARRGPTTSALRMLMRQERLLLARAEEHFLRTLDCYVASTRNAVLSAYGEVDAYGAAAKAVTRFAAAGLTCKDIRQCVDDSPLKIGKFLPGSGIPIVSREQWRQTKPAAEACVLSAWNYKREFEQREMEYIRAGGRFVK